MMFTSLNESDENNESVYLFPFLLEKEINEQMTGTK